MLSAYSSHSIEIKEQLSAFNWSLQKFSLPPGEKMVKDICRKK